MTRDGVVPPTPQIAGQPDPRFGTVVAAILLVNAKTMAQDVTIQIVLDATAPVEPIALVAPVDVHFRLAHAHVRSQKHLADGWQVHIQAVPRP